MPLGHPWFRQQGRGSAWGSSDSISGGRVCSGVFGEGITRDVASVFCMRCLLGVRSVGPFAVSPFPSGGVGHSSPMCIWGASLICGGGRSIIVGLRR